MATDWQSVNKFRLGVIVTLSLLTSTSMSLGMDELTFKAVLGIVVNGLIAGFAYMERADRL